jgi:hypothetical protein
VQHHTGGFSRRGFLTAAGAVAALPVMGFGAANASTPDGRHGTTVRVVVTPERVTVSPNRIPAGLVHLEVSTTSPTMCAPGLLRLNPGVELETFLKHYAEANSKDEAIRRLGINAIDREAKYLGGATVTAVSPIKISVLVDPGTHHIFNYNTISTPYLRDSIVPLRVERGHGRQRLPRTWNTIEMCDERTRSRYVMPDCLRHNGSYLVTNLTPQTNELTWLRLVDDATGQDVRDFWAAVAAGRQPSRNILLSAPEGLAPLSPGRSAVFTPDFPPGKYLVTSFMYDRETWVKGTFQGFWKIVTLY